MVQLPMGGELGGNILERTQARERVEA